MKTWIKITLSSLVALLLIAAWVVYFHNAFVAGAMPKWGWVQAIVTHLGQAEPVAAAEDEDPNNFKNEIPVHVAKVSLETLHHYIDGIGTIVPSPPRLNQPAGSANIAAPMAGVVAKVLCQVGQSVHAGDALIQLDDRLAISAEDQADAALAQAEASLANLRAMPRPDQLKIAELAVEKAAAAAQFAQSNLDRVNKLFADQGASTKTVEQATLDLHSTQGDLSVAEKQLAILKASPTPEDLNQEQARVAQAKAAAAAAHTQRQMLTITAPIDATVVSVSINPGEPVDPTKPIVQLVALDRLTVDVDVPSDELPANAEKLAAEIRPTKAAADETPPIIGKVAVVAPQVDPRNGAVTLSIDLPKDAGLRPGLSVRVRIIAGEHKDCFAVPRQAVVSDENGDSVIAVVEGDQATHKSVKLGYEENGLIEIIADGLSKDMTVVTAGAFGLPQATRVRIEP